MLEVLAPPVGLNTEEIATDVGLQTAIQREAINLHKAKEAGERISKDTIRLIIFLAGEICRRISNLTPEQKIELQRLRDTAEERNFERRTREISEDVDDFITDINTSGMAIKFSRVNELEDRVSSIMKNLGKNPDKYMEILDKVTNTLEKLQKVKEGKKMLGGLEEF